MNRNRPRQSGSPLSPQETWILMSLCTGERHGAGIIREIEELSKGKVSMGPGTLYENLARMLQGGLIERAGERLVDKNKNRKVYRASGVGQRVLREHLETLQYATSQVFPENPPLASGIS